MTESEWLESDDPAAMLRFLNCEGGTPVNPPRRPPSDRQLRLFACACCRQVWHLLTDECSRRAVEVAERYADGLATEKELARADADATDVPDRFLSSVSQAASWVAAWVANRYASRTMRSDVIDNLTWLEREAPGTFPPGDQAALLRDIAGTPWRPVRRDYWCPSCESGDADGKVDAKGGPPTCLGCGKVFSPCLLDWLTADVLAVGRATYEERGTSCKRCQGRKRISVPDEEKLRRDRARHIYYLDPPKKTVDCPACRGAGRVEDGTLDPVRLAVLADALEEAGCGNENLLGHLRRECVEGMGPCDYHPHVRGCWALDLILGKE